MAHGELDEETLQDLYSWVDAIPLSRPKRNIARDFSDGVLAAEVVKFYFPKMVEMHNYVPANSTQQKLSNWGHLNRKVLNKLNFSVPEDVIRKIAQCSPGVVELVLIPLRQKIEEKQKQAKVSSTSYQELGMRSTQEESNYMDTGYSSKPRSEPTGPYNLDSPGSEKGTKGQPVQADSILRLHLAEREQALLACQETVQAACCVPVKNGLLLICQKFYTAPEQQQLAGEMATANKGTKPKVGGVRFAPNQTVEGPSSHVHFDEKLHDSVVMVTQEKDGNFLVKVGFLKILHKYEISFLLPFVQRLGKEVSAVPLPNLNLRVIDIAPASEGYNIKCEYTAHKEGVLREEMQLCSAANNSASVKVVVQARVMDRHHGTPMLLEGVKCVGAELEYDSEQSEWPGFD